MNKNVKAILDSRSPKKILSLDGGGIRGLMTVEILAKLESDLRKEKGDEKLVLSDYFDFVCGTSTGAIIASCISCGMPMNKIREFYIENGKEMFDKTSWFKEKIKYKYRDESLATKLRSELNKALNVQRNDATLGNENLKTLLMMVMRNHTTDSPWPISNNPNAKYNKRDRKDCNLNLPLWKLVRASTAAPTYFPPEKVVFSENTDNEYSFIFEDGGMTTYNNPAFLAFQIVSTEPYKLNWQVGEDELLIVSIGTGNAPNERLKANADGENKLYNARNIPISLMNAATSGWDMTCRILGRCRYGKIIDREFGNMVITDDKDKNYTGDKLFSYVRYDPDLTKEGLLELDLSNISPETIQELDAIENIESIQQVGKVYAEKFVKLEHLGKFI